MVERCGQLISRPTARGGCRRLTVRRWRYAADVLGADGFILMTNYGGAYLGDDRFEPVFAELDHRNASVLVHPTTPASFGQLGLGRPGPRNRSYPCRCGRRVL